VLALDVGGTKLAAALVDDNGHVVRQARTETPDDPWPACLALLEQVRAGEQVRGVGAGCGGPMTWPDGFVSPLNMPAWQHFPLRDRLVEAYPDGPVQVHNDAVCVALGEHWTGAARGVDDVLGMVVSTGVGGGLVLGGRLHSGPSGNAGHVGHLVVEPDGPLCGCGARGCLEAVARGPAIVAAAAARGCPARDGRELAVLAEAGDPVAVATFARAAIAVGRAAASVAALLDLRLVVVGGGIAASGQAFWGPLERAFADQARLGFLAGAAIVPASLGAQAGLVGAAALVLRDY